VSSILDIHITPKLGWAVEHVDEVMRQYWETYYSKTTIWTWENWFNKNKQSYYDYYRVGGAPVFPDDKTHEYWCFLSTRKLDMPFTAWLKAANLEDKIVFQSPEWVRNALYPTDPPKLKMYIVKNPNYVRKAIPKKKVLVNV